MTWRTYLHGHLELRLRQVPTIAGAKSYYRIHVHQVWVDGRRRLLDCELNLKCVRTPPESGTNWHHTNRYTLITLTQSL